MGCFLGPDGLPVLATTAVCGGKDARVAGWKALWPGRLPPALLQRPGCLTWAPVSVPRRGESPVGEGVCSQEEQVLLPPRCVHQGPRERGPPCAGEAWCTARRCRCAGRESLGTRTWPEWHPRAAGRLGPWAGACETVAGRPAGQRAAVVPQGSWMAGEVAGSQAGTTPSNGISQGALLRQHTARCP